MPKHDDEIGLLVKTVPLSMTFTVQLTVELNPAEYIPSTPFNRFQGHDVARDLFAALERNLVGSREDGVNSGLTIMTPSGMSEYGEVTGFQLENKNHTILGRVVPDGKWLARKYGRLAKR